MVKFILLAVTSLIILNSCSYQKMNPSVQQFAIDEIQVNGNERTSFLIERKIKRFSQKGSSNKLAIIINLSKKKDIHEKNIQNKVTKYKLTLRAETNIKNLKNLDVIKRSYSSSTIYNVESKYTDTLNNEKEANSRLIDLIVSQLLDELKINYN